MRIDATIRGQTNQSPVVDSGSSDTEEQEESSVQKKVSSSETS
mgnify:CR=1 FL=1